MKFKEFYINEAADRYFYHGSGYDFNKFDMLKVGSGDGLNKYGYGLYFADNEDLAAYYAIENSIGKTKARMMYTVKLKELDQFYGWEEETPEEVYNDVIEYLDNNGFEKDAEEIRQDLEGYGDRWSIDSLYQFLKVVLKSDKKTTDVLFDCGVSGVIADDIHSRGKIYVAYSDRIINIVDKRSI